MTGLFARGVTPAAVPSLALLLILAAPAAAQEAADLYQRGADAFADGLFANAAQTFTTLVERHPGSELRADAAFLLALARYHLQEHAESLALLRAFADRHADSEHVAVLDHWRAANLMAQGRAEEAAALAERQLGRADAPADYRWRTLLLHAGALEAAGRPADAERAYLSMVGELPESERADALFRAGQIAYQAGRYADAAETFGRIVFDHAGSARAPQALFAQADASLLAGEHGTAAERFTRYLELFPDGELAATAWSRLPFLYLADQQFALAADYADRALAHADAGLTGRLLQVKGEAAFQLGQPDRAVDALQQALDAGLGPGDAQRAAYYLALAFLGSDRRSSGLEWLQQAGGGPDAELAASAVLNRAYLLIEDGELAAGAAELQRFADRYPNHPDVTEALQVLARTREALGETEAALDAWERLTLAVEAGGLTGVPVSAGSASLATLLRAADAAVAVDQDDRALALLARLRRLGAQPESLEGVYRIGRIYGTRGEHRRAADFYREVVETAPQGELYWRARLALGAELFNAGEYREARGVLGDGDRGGVWEPYRYLALGRVHYRLRESDQATEALAVAARAPDAAVAAEASYLYAAALYQGGRYEGSRDAYLAFADRYPDAAQVPSAFYRAALSALRLDRREHARELFAAGLATIEVRESAPAAAASGAAAAGSSGVGGVDLAQEILYMLVDGALADGRIEDAAAALDKLRARAPDGLMAAEAGLRYGQHLVAQGRTEAGLQALRQVADYGDEGPGWRALSAAAQAAETLGRYGEAADLHWRTLLAAHDTGLRERALAGLRVSFTAIGATAAQRHYLRAAAATDAELPADVRARVMYDYAVLIHPQQPDAAASILQASLPDLGAGPDRDDGYFLLAEHYRQAGEPQRAIDAYRVVSEVAVAGGGRQAEAYLRQAQLTVETEGEAAAAGALADVALRFPQQGEVASEALYFAITLYRQAGAERSANRLRDRLLERYPDSEWTERLRSDQAA